MTLLNYIIHIVLCFLLQHLVEVKSQTTIITEREGHAATFINDKLYILGGVIPPFGSNVSPKETFLYLDCSAPFNTNELEWIDLSSNNIVPPHMFAAAIKAGASNDTLFLYGGESLGGKMSPVYTFDTKNNKWSVPIIAGISPSGRIATIPIVDSNELIYVFGGHTDNPDIYYNDMFILDTINLSWKSANSINAPSPRTSYGAVLLPNKSILYMGGYNRNSSTGEFALDVVYLYDTTSNIWTTKATSGLIPSKRTGFSSVLGLDGQRVIIFGGLSNRTVPTLETSLYVLDLNNFGWYVPKTIGNIPSVRAYHRTVLIGKYMVVTFGRGYTQGVDNDLLLLDISNNNEYIWTTSFVPPSTSSSSSTPTGVTVGMVIGSVFGGVLLSIGSFLIHKRYKNNKKQNKAIPTPGN